MVSAEEPLSSDIVFGTLALAGNLTAVVGNILVCVTIYKSSRLRTPTNVYIAAIAIIGLLFAVFIGPSITVTLFAGRKWVFGKQFCNFQGFMILFIEYATLHTIALTAFNRFCRMLKPFYYKKMFPSKRRSSAILFLVWIIQIGFISIFCLPSIAKFEYNSKRASCILMFNENREAVIITYNIIKATFHFGLTAITVVYCYAKVFCRIREHTRKVSCTFRTDQAERVNVEEIRITRTVLGVVLFFLLCWIPEYIISIVIRVRPALMHAFAHRVVVFFLFLSCSFNPWVYAATNREFRAEFKSLLTGCKARQQDTAALSRQACPEEI